MKAIDQIRGLLADGRARSIPRISEELGLSRWSIQAAIDKLVGAGETKYVGNGSFGARMYRAYAPEEVDVETSMVEHPAHYNQGPIHSLCGKPIECWDVADHFGFLLGNSIRYIWRNEDKWNRIEDLEKAVQYLQKKIEILKGAQNA